MMLSNKTATSDRSNSSHVSLRQVAAAGLMAASRSFNLTPLNNHVTNVCLQTTVETLQSTQTKPEESTVQVKRLLASGSDLALVTAAALNGVPDAAEKKERDAEFSKKVAEGTANYLLKLLSAGAIGQCGKILCVKANGQVNPVGEGFYFQVNTDLHAYEQINGTVSVAADEFQKFEDTDIVLNGNPYQYRNGTVSIITGRPVHNGNDNNDDNGSSSGSGEPNAEVIEAVKVFWGKHVKALNLIYENTESAEVKNRLAAAFKNYQGQVSAMWKLDTVAARAGALVQVSTAWASLLQEYQNFLSAKSSGVASSLHEQELRQKLCQGLRTLLNEIREQYDFVDSLLP